MQLDTRHAGRSILLPYFQARSPIVNRVGPRIRWHSDYRIQSQVLCSQILKKKAIKSFRRDVSTFRYTPLNSSPDKPLIRLLEVYPGWDSHQVEASLKVAPLSEALQYEAVSYCWGNPKDVDNINCNGQQLEVPRRLEIALKNMRYTDRPRILCADAICINQQDDDEKESQVQLMRMIFSNAQRTLIFLGDAEEKQAQKMSKFALWSIQFGLPILRRRVDLLTSPKVRVWDENEEQFRVLAPFSSEFYLELIGMLRMEWFERAWVVQEVAISSSATIFWGSSQYDWEDVIQALKFMSQVNFPLAFIVTLENISTIEEERNLYREGHSTLNSILLRHQRCKASDPRDKIYSFCGLAKTSPGGHSPVRISYKDDVATIYREAALKILSDDQSLDLLSRPPSLSESGMKELPSWVPDWSISSTSTLTYAWGHGPLPLAGMNSSGTSQPRFATSRGSTTYSPKPSHTTSNALTVQGYEFDKIAKIGPIFQGVQVPHTVSSFPEILQEWVYLFYTLFRARNMFVRSQRLAEVFSKRRYPTGETMRDAFLQTLSAAEIHDSDRVKEELELWEKGTSFPFGLIYSAFVLLRNFVTDRPFLLFEIQGRYALHRRVVRTERGFLGLASHATRVGDEVMICKGSSVPLIMRRYGEDDEFWLIGDAYVHGIMKGEAFDIDKCREILIR